MIPRSVELLNVLSDHNVTFYIPPYQRNYEWGNNQCRVFLMINFLACANPLRRQS